MYYGTLVLLVQQLHIKHRYSTAYAIHKYFLEILAILVNDCTNKNTDYVPCKQKSLMLAAVFVGMLL